MRAAGVFLILACLVLVSALAGRLFLPNLGWLVPAERTRAAAPVGCPSMTVVGRYYSNEQPAQFLDFRSDGTVFISVGGGTATYAVDRGEVVISTAFTGAARATVPSSIAVPACGYNGPDFGAIYFAPGVGTAQSALRGAWVRRN